MAHAQRIRRFLSNKGISPAKTVLPLIRFLRPILSNVCALGFKKKKIKIIKCKDCNAYNLKGSEKNGWTRKLNGTLRNRSAEQPKGAQYE